jgi:hypothetical protein
VKFENSRGVHEKSMKNDADPAACPITARAHRTGGGGNPFKPEWKNTPRHPGFPRQSLHDCLYITRGITLCQAPSRNRKKRNGLSDSVGSGLARLSLTIREHLIRFTHATSPECDMKHPTLAQREVIIPAPSTTSP